MPTVFLLEVEQSPPPPPRSCRCFMCIVCMTWWSLLVKWKVKSWNLRAHHSTHFLVNGGIFHYRANWSRPPTPLLSFSPAGFPSVWKGSGRGILALSRRSERGARPWSTWPPEDDELSHPRSHTPSTWEPSPPLHPVISQKVGESKSQRVCGDMQTCRHPKYQPLWKKPFIWQRPQLDTSRKRNTGDKHERGGVSGFKPPSNLEQSPLFGPEWTQTTMQGPGLDSVGLILIMV